MIFIIIQLEYDYMYYFCVIVLHFYIIDSINTIDRGKVG